MEPTVDQYRFVVHPKDVDGDYLVTCPAFGTEFSAFGSTLVCPVAGPLYIEVVGRELVAECVVLPPAQDALIGQVVLESLDLIADCAKPVVYPRHGSLPYPVLNLKGFRRKGRWLCSRGRVGEECRRTDLS